MELKTHISTHTEAKVKFCERQRTYGSLPQLKHNFVKIDQGILSLQANLYTTRNQYASPPEGNAIAAGPLCDFWNVFFTKLDAGEGVSSQYLQQKYFNHLKRRGYNKDCQVNYIHCS